MKKNFGKKWCRNAGYLLAAASLLTTASLLAAEPGMAYAAETAETAIETMGTVETTDLLETGEETEITEETTSGEMPDAGQEETVEASREFVGETVNEEEWPEQQEGIALFLISGKYKPYENATYRLSYSSFSNDSGLTITGYTGTAEGELVIPDVIEGMAVTSIYQDAFKDCSGFTGDLTIPASVTSIGYAAFEGCSGFTGNLIISDGVTSIASCAFRDCNGFTGDLIIPGSVTSIGSSAFEGCSGFTGDLIISDGVTSIGDWAFHDCSGFTGDLTIPDSVTYIDGAAFAGCKGFTGNLTISDNVTSIKNSTFYGCSGFTGSLTIPDGVTSIGWCAFHNCSGFTGDLIIPDSVTYIDFCAFVGCTGFNRNVYLSDKVTSIDIYALLTPLSQKATHEEDDSWYFLDDTKEIRKSVIIHAPKGSYAERWATRNECTFVPYRMLTSGDNIFVGYGEDGNADAEISLETRHLAVSDPEYADIIISDKVLDSTVEPGAVKFEAYDITLVDGNKQPVQPSGKVKVSIPCPAGYTGENCKVYRVNGDGSLTDMAAAYSGSCIVFTTNHFSTYIITETELQSGTEVEYGDVNGDGSVNSLDAVMIKRHLAGYEDLQMDLAAADVNADGRVNSLDAVKILQKLAGYEVILGEK